MPIADVSDKSLQQLISMAGRRAVVTGGAQGLGKAIARRLAEAGAAVLIADRNLALAQETAAGFEKAYGNHASAVILDAADEQSMTQAAKRAIEDYGGIDIWVNNAGIYPFVRLVDLDVKTWDEVMAVNMRGVFLGTREAARQMITAAQGGVIVNVASAAGFRAEGPGLTAYGASKHGVRGLTCQTALELAPYGIRVMGVAPTFCKTEGNMAALAASPKLAEEIATVARTPLGRIGQADDLARAAFFCASDLSMFMTGSTLVVDGGSLA